MTTAWVARLVACVLALLLGNSTPASASPAVTTTNSAPAYVYDVATVASVDVRTGGGVDSGSAQFTGLRERDVAPAGSIQGTSTTPAVLGNATEAVPGGSNRAIVIGEDMEGRVIPKARELGADYYDPPIAPRNQWMENNLQWINDRMDEGCTIYNCGPAPGRANYPNPTSPYYQMELDEIAKRNYPIIEVR